MGRLELILFGTSLVGFRVLSAAAVSLIMVLAGLIAKELGGKRQVQVLAAIAAGIAPVSLIQGAVFQYVSFDYLWGVTVTYFLVRLLNSDDSRWWMPIGVVLGVGMETRYTMGFLALFLAGAVLLTPQLCHQRSLLQVSEQVALLGSEVAVAAMIDFAVAGIGRHFAERAHRV